MPMPPPALPPSVPSVVTLYPVFAICGDWACAPNDTIIIATIATGNFSARFFILPPGQCKHRGTVRSSAPFLHRRVHPLFVHGSSGAPVLPDVGRPWDFPVRLFAYLEEFAEFRAAVSHAPEVS